jgi:tetraacyldisaccharide 4'-kinase
MTKSTISSSPLVSDACSSTFEAIVSGHLRGMTASVARCLLHMPAAAYATVMRVRNGRYNRGIGIQHADVPVISVGNITVGGTGKTPMTIGLAERLAAMGRRPAILTRGYKAATAGDSDEVALLRKRCPMCPVVVDPDRLRGARAAAHGGADVVLLDDGFQHRRLARDLDIVLIDATRPFGYEHVLPRGMLREPLVALRRADLFIVTRCDQVDRGEVDAICARNAAIAPNKPIVRSVHRAGPITVLAGGQPDSVPSLSAKRCLLFAGIARPACFARTVRDLGHEIVETRWFADHHAYTPADVHELAAAAKRTNADAVITTEKDAVKLSALRLDFPCALCTLPVEIAFLDDGDTIIDAALRRVLSENGTAYAE